MEPANDTDGPLEPGTNEPRRIVAEMAELVGGLAHELRNPLSIMMVNLKLLAEDLEDIQIHPEDARRRGLHKVQALQHEAKRLQRLFDQFLHLTDPYYLDPVPSDLNEIVRSLVEFFEGSAEGEDIEVQFTPADAPLMCRVDEQRIRQGLLNILINAQQAMPDGGVLGIRTTCEADGAVVAISDTGPGIAPEDRERILRPFYSTKAHGSGLGLSITQRIIREHGGTLTLESMLGEGTTFLVWLPFCDPVEDSAARKR